MVGETQTLFPTLAFLACQILGIVGSQIETKRIFSLLEILTNLKICHLQSNNLYKIIFFNKNWPSDPRVGSSSPSSFIQLIEVDLALEEKLQQYASEFEWDELLDL